jgi:hypothetical protein
MEGIARLLLAAERTKDGSMVTSGASNAWRGKRTPKP